MDPTNSKVCIKCGNFIEKKSNFCLECGASQETCTNCKKCGTKIPLGAKFCSNCGAKDGIVAAASPPPLPVFQPGGNAIPLRILGVFERPLQSALLRASEQQQLLFISQYQRESREEGIAYLLWFLGFHYAYLGKWGCFIFYWISIFFLVGLGWWFIDLFRVGSLVRNYNRVIATEIASNLRII